MTHKFARHTEPDCHHNLFFFLLSIVRIYAKQYCRKVYTPYIVYVVLTNARTSQRCACISSIRRSLEYAINHYDSRIQLHKLQYRFANETKYGRGHQNGTLFVAGPSAHLFLCSACCGASARCAGCSLPAGEEGGVRWNRRKSNLHIVRSDRDSDTARDDGSIPFFFAHVARRLKLAAGHCSCAVSSSPAWNTLSKWLHTGGFKKASLPARPRHGSSKIGRVHIPRPLERRDVTQRVHFNVVNIILTHCYNACAHCRAPERCPQHDAYTFRMNGSMGPWHDQIVDCTSARLMWRLREALHMQTSTEHQSCRNMLRSHARVRHSVKGPRYFAIWARWI